MKYGRSRCAKKEKNAGRAVVGTGRASCASHGKKAMTRATKAAMRSGTRAWQLSDERGYLRPGRCLFQAEAGIRDIGVTGVQTCALPIYVWWIIGLGVVGGVSGYISRLY